MFGPFATNAAIRNFPVSFSWCPARVGLLKNSHYVSGKRINLGASDIET